MSEIPAVFRASVLLPMWRCFGFLLLFHLFAWSRLGSLPPVPEIDRRLAADPVQTPTERPPFEVRKRGVVYHIRPMANYELRGLVVSYHDSDSWIDFYHKLWNDHLNFRDLGVVWGFNALGGVYRDIRFSNSDFTLEFQIDSDEVLNRFRLDQVSNNHLLAGKSEVEETLRKIGKGDQILLRGVLCEYSHQGGRRGTSLTRTDHGNGACETMYVDSVSILREGNAGWRFFHGLSGFLLKLMIPILIWQAWSALRAQPGEVTPLPEPEPGEPEPV
jgi:hypothetical protein